MRPMLTSNNKTADARKIAVAVHPDQALDIVSARTARYAPLRVVGPGDLRGVCRQATKIPPCGQDANSVKGAGGGNDAIAQSVPAGEDLVSNPTLLGFRFVRHTGFSCVALLEHPAVPKTLYKIVDTHHDGWWPWALACLTVKSFRADPNFLRVHRGWRLDDNHVIFSMERLAAPVHITDENLIETTARLQAILSGSDLSRRETALPTKRIERSAYRLRDAFGDALSPDMRPANIMARRVNDRPRLVIVDPYGLFR